MTKVIAEIGWNHMGDMNLAKEMIAAASESGASYAKFQTWSVSRLKNGPWDDDGRREIYIKAELSKDQHYELKEYCDKMSIDFMSSVFSIEDAVLLNDVTKTTVKIPSAESRNLKLLNFVNGKFDTIYMSTGTSTFEEIRESAKLINESKLVLFHCVSSYPCTIDNSNLNRISHLQEICKDVGYSDHVEGINAARISLEFNICMIEKHFTIDKDLPGRDNKFAILPNELKSLTEYISERNNGLIDQGKDYLISETEVRDVYSGRFSNH